MSRSRRPPSRSPPRSASRPPRSRRPVPRERCEQELHRIVERADDRHHAERFAQHVRLRGLQVRRRVDALGAKPGPQVLAHGPHFGGHEVDLGEERFGRRLAQVGAQCVRQFVPGLAQHPVEALELLQPPRQRLGPARREMGVQPSDCRGNVVAGHAMSLAGSGRRGNPRRPLRPSNAARDNGDVQGFVGGSIGSAESHSVTIES